MQHYNTVSTDKLYIHKNMFLDHIAFKVTCFLTNLE